MDVPIRLRPGLRLIRTAHQMDEDAMAHLKERRVVVAGGSRGLGFAMVEALLARGARVTVIARGTTPLTEIEGLGATVVIGDATDAVLMDKVVADVAPSVLILNAGATPHMAPLDEQSWDSFSAVWNTDVKASLHGVQAALRTPMPQGSRVLLVSSGAAMVLGVPFIRPEKMSLSGGYVGAKRIIWLMAHNANGVARARGLGIHFQALLPLQLIGDTRLGRTVAAAYAEREGTTIEEHLSARYGKPLEPRQYGEQVVELLTAPRYEAGVAYGFKTDMPIAPLDV
jgi:hypothetical protein